MVRAHVVLDIAIIWGERGKTGGQPKHTQERYDISLGDVILSNTIYKNTIYFHVMEYSIIHSTALLRMILFNCTSQDLIYSTLVSYLMYHL